MIKCLAQGHKCHGWDYCVLAFSNMRSYLLGDVPVEENPSPTPQHDQQLAHLDLDAEEADSHPDQELATDSGPENGAVGIDTQNLSLNTFLESGAAQESGDVDIDTRAYADEEVMSSGQDEDSDVIMEEEEEEILDEASDEDRDGHVSEEEEEEEEGEEAQDAPVNPDQPVDQPAAPGGMALHAAHHALINQMGPTGFQPYNKPSFFAFRVSSCQELALNPVLGLWLDVIIPGRVDYDSVTSKICHSCSC